MRKPTKVKSRACAKLGSIACVLRRSVSSRRRYCKTDDLFLIRILDEARRLDNLINKSNEICLLRTVEIELNNFPVNETIEKKTVFIQTLKEMSGNVKKSLKRENINTHHATESKSFSLKCGNRRSIKNFLQVLKSFRANFR